MKVFSEKGFLVKNIAINQNVSEKRPGFSPIKSGVKSFFLFGLSHIL
jgi:hypothetical protein